MFDWMLHPSVVVPLLSFCFLAFGDEAGSASAMRYLVTTGDNPPRRLPRPSAIVYAVTRDRMFWNWVTSFVPILVIGLLLHHAADTGKRPVDGMLTTLFVYLGIIIPIVFVLSYIVGFARTWRNAPVKTTPVS